MNGCDQNRLTIKTALSILEASDVKLTPQAFIRHLKQAFGLSSKKAKQCLKDWVDARELCYQYHFGTTYVEKNFLRPVRITPCILLTPPGCQSVSDSRTEIEVRLEQGISFGSGSHPTTQLCLEALDDLFFTQARFKNRSDLWCADVGTGSGVLAIVLCKLGFGYCDAFEIDPLSVCEARKNVTHNRLKNRVKIIDDPMTEDKERYAVICANLRYPTLKALSPLIWSSLMREGVVILSGVREWEKGKLIDQYCGLGFEMIRQADKKQWSAFVFKKNLC